MATSVLPVNPDSRPSPAASPPPHIQEIFIAGFSGDDFNHRTVTDHPIHIAREGRSLGRFAPEDVAAGLRTGRFMPTDLAWRDPMPDWVALSDFPGLPEVPEESTAEQEFSTPRQISTPDLPLEPAWERIGEIGWLRALPLTVSEILARPARVFAAMPVEERPTAAFWFYLILTTLTGWVALSYQYAAARVNPEMLGKSLLDLMEGKIDLLFLLMAVALPIANLLSAVLFPLVFQLGLRVLVDRPLKFFPTFRVYCYAWGAASVLQLLPICGAYAYLGYAIYLTVTGLRDVHRIPTMAASLAVILPVLLCYGAVMLLTVGGDISPD